MKHILFLSLLVAPVLQAGPSSTGAQLVRALQRQGRMAAQSRTIYSMPGGDSRPPLSSADKLAAKCAGAFLVGVALGEILIRVRGR